MFNLAFVPTIYFLYPETADRTLEDLDGYFRTNPPLLVFRDKDVISNKRPAAYIEAEEDNVRRASSVNADQFRRQSRISIGNQRTMSHASEVSHSTLGGGQHTEHEKQSKLDDGANLEYSSKV